MTFLLLNLLTNCCNFSQEMLEGLEADGLTLVIITNGHHEIQRAKLARCNADNAIRHVLVGGEEVCIL